MLFRSHQSLAPMSQIAENAGYNSDEIVEKQMKSPEGQGFDAKDGELVAMFAKTTLIPFCLSISLSFN